MHRSKVSLVEWFWTAWVMGQDKRGVSALQLSRLLKRRYDTVWRLLHKVRAVLRENANAFPLAGVIVADETYTGGKTSVAKGGRSLADPRRSVVGLAVERIPTKVGVRGSGFCCGSARLEVLGSACGAELLAFIDRSCAAGATVRSDGWSGYFNLENAGYTHDREVEGNPQNASELFPLVHTIFSNLKAWMAGTFHGVTATWLPAYVAEFNYRFNRRKYAETGELWRYLLRRAVSGLPQGWETLNERYQPRRAA